MKIPATEKANSDSRSADGASNQLSTSQLNAEQSKDLKPDVATEQVNGSHVDDVQPNWQTDLKEEPVPAAHGQEPISYDQVPGGIGKDIAFEPEIGAAPKVNAKSTVEAEISYQHPDTPVTLSATWTESDAKLGLKIDITDDVSAKLDVGWINNGPGAHATVDSGSSPDDQIESDDNPGIGAGGDPDPDGPIDTETEAGEDKESESLLDQFLNAIGLGDEDEPASSSEDAGSQQNDNSSNNDESDNSSNNDDDDNSDDGSSPDDEEETGEVEQAEGGEESDDGTEPPPEDDYDPEMGNPKAVSAEQWDAAEDKLIGQQSWDVTPGWDDGSGDNPDSKVLFDVNEGKPVVNPKETVYDDRPDATEYQDQMSAEAISVVGDLAMPTDDDADGVWGQPDPGPGPTDPFGGTDPTATEFMFFEHEPLPQGIMGAAPLPMSKGFDSDIGADPDASFATEADYDMM